jgi:hypothetical protein
LKDWALEPLFIEISELSQSDRLFGVLEDIITKYEKLGEYMVELVVEDLWLRIFVDLSFSVKYFLLI